MNFTSDGTIRTPPTRPPLTTFPGDARTTVARRTHASGKLTLAYHAKTLTNENVCFEHCDFLTVPSTPNPFYPRPKAWQAGRHSSSGPQTLGRLDGDLRPLKPLHPTTGRTAVPKHRRTDRSQTGGPPPVRCTTRRPEPTDVKPQMAAVRAGPPVEPTTSFLTATTLIYTIGAGITAAAGTRLALQSILCKWFKLSPFRTSRRAGRRYFSSLPPLH